MYWCSFSGPQRFWVQAKSFFSLIDGTRGTRAPCVIEFLWSRLHVVVFGGLAYQQNAQDRPSSRKGTVAAQSAFIGRSAYSRKNTSADSSACASLTCESRAYSVIFQQKGSAQQGKAVYLTAFRINYAPPAKVLLLFSLRRLPMGSEASLHWRSIFESTTLHVAESLNVWTWILFHSNSQVNCAALVSVGLKCEFKKLRFLLLF